MTIDGSKHTNDITSLHSQTKTSWLNWQTTNNIMTWLTNQVKNQSLIPSTDEIQLTLTLKIDYCTGCRNVNYVNNNSPIQDYVH